MVRPALPPSPLFMTDKDQDQTPAKAGRNAVPLALVKKRRAEAVGLRISGMSIAAITRKLNKDAETENWGTVSERTVKRDIAKHYRDNAVSTIEDFDHNEQMRQAHIASMEETIGALSIHIHRKSDWKPFEYEKALETLHKMRMDLAEVMNWNLGRKNPLLAAQTNIFNLPTMHEATQAEIQKTQPEAVRALIEQFRGVADEFRNDDRREVEEDEVIEADYSEVQKDEQPADN